MAGPDSTAVASDPTESGGARNNADGNQGTVRGASILETGKPVTIDPATVSAGSAGSGPADSGPKRRGRKPRATPASAGFTGAEAGQTLDISGIEKILLSSHMIMSVMLKAPNLKLDQGEARALAEATVNVTRHYNVVATQKTIDWVNLVTCAVMIYGTRAIAYSAGRKKARDDAANPVTNGAGGFVYSGAPTGPVMQ